MGIPQSAVARLQWISCAEGNRVVQKAREGIAGGGYRSMKALIVCYFKLILFNQCADPKIHTEISPTFFPLLCLQFHIFAWCSAAINQFFSLYLISLIQNADQGIFFSFSLFKWLTWKQWVVFLWYLWWTYFFLLPSIPFSYAFHSLFPCPPFPSPLAPMCFLYHNVFGPLVCTTKYWKPCRAFILRLM